MGYRRGKGKGGGGGGGNQLENRIRKKEKK